MNTALVIMGVAGCGKSSLGAVLAKALGAVLVEGDNFHSARNLEKMRHGIALTDADRASWLDTLAAQLLAHPEGVVLTCSALKLRYRDRLRAARADLRFAFLDIALALAEKRVAERGDSHFFSASLVQNQFATLEPPTGEPGVLHLDGSLGMEQLTARVQHWLNTKEIA